MSTSIPYTALIYVLEMNNDTNTIEKPTTNWRAPLTFEIFEFLFNENIAKYPGTSGRTHGEKKERAPKRKAIDALISIY